GSALLWLAWALMPDAATADAAHILAAVGGARASVRASALVQLAACAALAPGVLHVAGRGTRATFAGGALLPVGAMGMAADAVYHQLAVEMTAPGVDASAMLPVMTAMQTRDIRSLAPLMLAYPAGAFVLVAGLVRERRASRWAARLAALAGLLVLF